MVSYSIKSTDDDNDVFGFRRDVAAICVESIDSKSASRTSFEAYYQDSGRPLANVGFSNLLKLTNDKSSTSKLTGFERRASVWPKLFDGLTPDKIAAV